MARYGTLSSIDDMYMLARKVGITYDLRDVVPSLRVQVGVA